MSVIITLIVSVLLVAIDQISKYLIITNINYGHSVEILPGVVDFTYIHNTGAAFGMLQGKSWVLLSVSAIVVLVCLALLLKKTFNSKLLFCAISLIMAGGLGNMIDRIFRAGNVIDFIELKFVDFAVFNFADCCVTIGAILIIYDFFREWIRDLQAAKKTAEEDTL